MTTFMTTHRYQQTRLITLLGGMKNLFLAGIKIISGLNGHSHSLLADGIHSLADLLADGLVLAAAKWGSKSADQDHPYGHGRIETAAIMLLALVLILAGVSIIIDAGIILLTAPVTHAPEHYVMWIALLSVGLNEIIYYGTHYLAKTLNSRLLLTNAWHHRSDSASSVVVVFGVAGSWLGFPKLDAIAALIVGSMISKAAWKFGRDSIYELVDTASDTKTTEQISQLITSIAGVHALHQLRTRSVGGAIFCDVHILVDPDISVSEGHFISQKIQDQLLASIPAMADVTVHIDPEDDQANSPSCHLPTRPDLIALLKQRWHGLIADQNIEQIILHYLAGKLTLELTLPLHAAQDRGLTKALETAVADQTFIAAIKFYYQ